MRRLLATLAGVLVLAIAIAAFAPASLVDARLDSMTGGAIRLAEARGTLWHGGGRLTSPDGLWRLPVHWTLDPLPLLSGVTSIRLDAANAAADALRGRLEFRDHRILAESLVARVPAAAVATLAGPAATQAGGDIEVRVDALTLAPTGSSGGLAARWQNARLVGAGWPVLDLGTVTAKLSVRGNALAGPVSNESGVVRVSGDVSIAPDRVAADLRLTPNATASPAVQKALSALGTPDASGVVSLRLDRRTR